MSGRGIVEAEIFRSELIEANARTSDPTNPAVGDFWIRSDVQPSVSGATTVAALRIQGPGGVLEVPLFDSSEASNLGADVYVGERRRFDDGTVGFIAETDQGGSLGSPRLLAPDGTEYQAHDALEVNAIPDSVQYQWNTLDAFGSSDEGTTTTSWPSEFGSTTLSGGSPTVVGSGINGYRALDYDGTNDQLGASLNTVSQPFTIFAVVNQADTSGEARVIGPNSGTDPRILLWYSSNNTQWRMFSGSTLGGSSDTTAQLLVAHYDGENSYIREDGTQTGSGDAGTNNLESISVGSEAGSNFWGENVGFVETHDGEPSNGLTTREQEVADLFGIPL